MRAQSGVVEFLILVILMLFLVQQSFALAAQSRKAGVLLLERAVVDRNTDRIEFIIREHNNTGAGRQTVRIGPQPFLKYSIQYEQPNLTISAISDYVNYSQQIFAPGLKLTDCGSEVTDSLTIVIQSWESKTEVMCK